MCRDAFRIKFLCRVWPQLSEPIVVQVWPPSCNSRGWEKVWREVKGWAIKTRHLCRMAYDRGMTWNSKIGILAKEYRNEGIPCRLPWLVAYILHSSYGLKQHLGILEFSENGGPINPQDIVEHVTDVEIECGLNYCSFSTMDYIFRSSLHSIRNESSWRIVRDRVSSKNPIHSTAREVNYFQDFFPEKVNFSG